MVSWCLALQTVYDFGICIFHYSQLISHEAYLNCFVHCMLPVSSVSHFSTLLLRSAPYSYSWGPVERPAVCLCPLSWSGHRLLFFLWCDTTQTQAETGTELTILHECQLLWFPLPNTENFSLAPGIRSGLPSICYPVRWHRSLLVSGWQWGLLFIRPRSGHCNQRGLSVLGWTTCLPVLPYRWIKMECLRSTERYWPFTM